MHAALLRPEATQGADDRLVPNPRLSANRSLAIYQQSYALRIAACMREQFPALCHALGEALFNDFVAEYVREAPPESYTLYDLGRRFTNFLEANRPDRDAKAREDWIDFVVDLSRFERVVFATFDGPGAEEMAMATNGTPDAALRLNPSLTIGTYRFPVAQYYHGVREKRAPSPPPKQTSHVAVLRKDYLTNTILLAAEHAAFLTEMQTQGHLPPNPPWAKTAKLRETWIRVGFFTEHISAET